MSLSALINGADCGPINPLQGLSKRFDADRGLAGDQFNSGRAGSSREVFRSQPAQASSAFANEAAAFFQGISPPSAAHQASPFDLSALNSALSSAASPGPTHAPRPTPTNSSWAKDFVVSRGGSGAPQTLSRANASWAGDFVKQQGSTATSNLQHGSMALAPSLPQLSTYQRSMYPMTMPVHQPLLQQMPSFNAHKPAPAIPSQANFDASALESHFSQIDSASSMSAAISGPNELVADDLATTAGLLIEALKGERSEKFKNSAFMGLMKQVRDHEMVVNGNDMVQASEGVSSAPVFETDPSALEIAQGPSIDVKGKMRAIDPSSSGRRKSVHFDEAPQVPVAVPEDFEAWDWSAPQASARKTRQVGIIEAQEAEWAKLQAEWEEWAATPTGFEKTATAADQGLSYQFHPDNPFLNPEYMTHYSEATSNGVVRSTYQSVLEKEADVQRNPHDANAWLALGMKQQENERESQAIIALSRALELDSTLLPAWLSLAISHTNEGSRHDAYQSLQQWIENNERYKIITTKYRFSTDEDPEKYISMRERRERLVSCLIDMATGAQTVGVAHGMDADVQIALAVLLNTSEEYEKALDCFKAALEVRPDDFVLYNRVGATLANSGKPEEALAYYYRALEFNPSYIRARYNLGISCISLRRYEEAASHMLDALVLQENDGTEKAQPQEAMASSLWDTLCTICHHLKRPDLAVLCEKRDLDGFRSLFQT